MDYAAGVVSENVNAWYLLWIPAVCSYPPPLGSVLLIFLSHLSSLRAARTWYWEVRSAPPFVASSSSHRALNCLESNGSVHSPLRWLSLRQQKGKTERGSEADVLTSSCDFRPIFPLIHKAPPMLPCSGFARWNWWIFSEQPKLHLYSLFCSWLFVWTISDPRVCVSLKRFTVERAGTNGAKSKLCNWILRGWLGIADLAVIKTTLFTLVLHHGYSKTADWPQMCIYTVATEGFYNHQIGSTGGYVR